ncbi:MAG: hypothetical protein ISP10_02275 [Aeromicrobium sp.]|nr:hypothetical protein [Aeromicrobium sp.]
MGGALIAIAALAGACAYVVGHAFVAPRDSMLRTAPGGAVLAGCVLIALGGPPVLAGFVGDAEAGSWVAAGGGLYHTLWVTLVAAGLLGGMRVWRMRPSGGGRRLFSLDESPVGRAAAQLPLADSLEDALDVLAREHVTARDVPRLAPVITRLGARFFHQLPERKSEAYAMVARFVPPAVAAEVTGLLLAGAGRK